LTEFSIQLMLSPQFEEARMKCRLNYLAIVVLLTLLDAVVTLYYGTAVWAAWSGDMLARGLLVLFAVLGATSLANVWVQAGSSRRVRSECPRPRRGTVPIPTEMRGQSDV
jgi:prepilin signal peptidase PulO-like enzyme (type II secretory pathway)